jgi:hypothetical protein
MTSRRRLGGSSGVLLACICALAFTARPAQSQTMSAGEEAARGELITRAQDAHKKGDHRGAIELAERAAAIRKSLTLWSFIAEEQEEVGALADAYATAQRCVRESALDREAMLRAEAVERCRGLTERLKARVSYVVVEVPTPPPGLTLSLSGQDLNRAAIGVPYVITPGKVVVEAHAPGRVPFRIEIDVPEGKTINVTVTMPPDGVSSAPAPAAPPAASPPPASPPPAPSPPPSPRFARTSIALFAAGGAALVTAGALRLVANERFDNLRSTCATSCTVQGRRSGIESIDRLDHWALGLAVSGAVLAGTGAVLRWALPRDEEPQALDVHVGVDPIARAVRVGGSF